MTGKERVLAAIRCEEVDRTPWVPFVGCHGGSLVGATAQQYLQSEDLMVKGLNEAVARYRPDGLPVSFDLQIEAEIFGCQLNWAEDNPPAVVSHPLAGGDVTLADLSIPTADQGRLAPTLAATRTLRKAHPDIALYGLITGPFTLALHLLGTDIFMRMFDDPNSVKALMVFAAKVGSAVAGYYIDAGCDVVAVVDPMTSQIGPDQFREFVTPYATEVFESVRERGALSSFFVCGHAQQNIEAMCECKPDNVSIDENIPLEFVRDVCLPAGISFGGNMQLTVVLLLGSPDDARRNAVACMEIGGEKGFVLAPGCDLPYATPPENLQAVTEVVHDEYKREVVKSLAVEQDGGPKMDMSQYGESDKVIVDVITLDSESCAPCQYMVESVKSITPEFEGIVEWREHKIKFRESLVFMTSLMVRNVPTICIDGQIVFVSRIPRREELIAAIQKRINEKLKIKIQQKKGQVFVIGRNEKEIVPVMANVDRAVQELGVEVAVTPITDERRVKQFGVMVTPAVVTARYQMKSSETVPTVEVIKEWIKDLTS